MRTKILIFSVTTLVLAGYGFSQNSAGPPVGGAPGAASQEPNGRVPLISATGRTPAEVDAATKTAQAVDQASEPAPKPAGNEVAKLPYQQLIKIAKSDDKQPEDAQFYFLRIGSALEGVKAADIELYLDIPESKMEIPVNADGIFQVPYSLDLYEQNPLLVANQPKGTLSISVQRALPKVDRPKVEDGKVKYQELFRPIIEMGKEMAKVDPNFGKDGQQQFALELITGKEPVVMKRALGSRTLRPNAEGKIYLVFERLLYDENPEVMVPDKISVNVKPVTPQEAALIRAQ